MNDKNKQKNCTVCNKTFAPNKHNPKQITCSKECGRQHIKEKNKKNYHKNKIKIEKTCPVCNNTYITSNSGKKYCSKECVRIKIRKRFRKWDPKKLTPKMKIIRKIRDRIYKALKNQNATKHTKTYKLIGCTVEEFKQYIKLQFKEGMSWDNHGDWHIDHIIPLASFDLTQKTEQLKAFHYSNCQPLWAKDNKKKGAKLY